MSTTSEFTGGTVNVGRITVTTHRGRPADLLCFRPELLCFSDHRHGAAAAAEHSH